MVIFGIIVILAVSCLLSKTALKGVADTLLELPPYRKPKFLNTIVVRTTLDKSVFVLKRAIMIGETSILMHMVQFFDPFVRQFGMDGFILMAFILGLPANEIVLPILLMSYLSKGAMIEVEDLDS